MPPPFLLSLIHIFWRRQPMPAPATEAALLPYRKNAPWYWFWP